jgi:hypothetical protein
MIFELKANGKTILRVNVWYLVLSAILRGDVSKERVLSMGDLVLTAEYPVRMGPQGDCYGVGRADIPQPIEFMGDSLKKD